MKVLYGRKLKILSWKEFLLVRQAFFGTIFSVYLLAQHFKEVILVLSNGLCNLILNHESNFAQKFSCPRAAKLFKGDQKFYFPLESLQVKKIIFKLINKFKIYLSALYKNPSLWWGILAINMIGTTMAETVTFLLHPESCLIFLDSITFLLKVLHIIRRSLKSDLDYSEIKVIKQSALMRRSTVK